MTPRWSSTSHEVLEWYEHDLNDTTNNGDDKPTQALLLGTGDMHTRLE